MLWRDPLTGPLGAVFADARPPAALNQRPTSNNVGRGSLGLGEFWRCTSAALQRGKAFARTLMRSTASTLRRFEAFERRDTLNTQRLKTSPEGAGPALQRTWEG